MDRYGQMAIKPKESVLSEHNDDNYFLILFLKFIILLIIFLLEIPIEKKNQKYSNPYN